MCRWAAYTGAPIFLEDIVSWPGHSLIAQSHDAVEGKTTINADGFGIAWYGERDEPGLFRDTYPAWSDPNLRSLTAQVRSRFFLAHVQASTGAATSRNNCHPFAVARRSFSHNGQIGGYAHFRRDADIMVPENLYAHRCGAIDSEALFLIALGEGLDNDPLPALARAVARFETLSRARGIAPHVRLTAALSQGLRRYAVRDATDDHAPTLYHRWNRSRWVRAVVSEPLEIAECGWEPIPQDTFCTFEGESVRIEQFGPARVVAVA